MLHSQPSCSQYRIVHFQNECITIDFTIGIIFFAVQEIYNTGQDNTRESGEKLFIVKKNNAPSSNCDHFPLREKYCPVDLWISVSLHKTEESAGKLDYNQWVCVTLSVMWIIISVRRILMNDRYIVSCNEHNFRVGDVYEERTTIRPIENMIFLKFRTTISDS